MGLQPAAHDRQHQRVAHQLTAGHHGFSFLPQLTTGSHFSPQQIAGGEVQQPLALSEALGLGALASARGAEEEEALLHDDGCERRKQEGEKKKEG
jgi:hypothetical protein